MSWTNICVEGFCFGEQDKEGNYPCGRGGPSHLCLENEGCPNFAWAKTSERDAAIFVPLYQIWWDKIKIWAKEVYWKLRWYFWDKWHFEPEWYKKFPSISSDECAVLKVWEEEREENKQEFKVWFDSVKREEE